MMSEAFSAIPYYTKEGVVSQTLTGETRASVEGGTYDHANGMPGSDEWLVKKESPTSVSVEGESRKDGTHHATSIHNAEVAHTLHDKSAIQHRTNRSRARRMPD